MSNTGENMEAGPAPSGHVAPNTPLVAAKEEFDRFYNREYQAMTGDRQQAQDLTQDAFVAAYQKWDTIDTPSAWVRTVVANRAKSWFRSRYREARALMRLRQPEPDLPAELQVESAQFWATVRSLPARQAQALTLFYLEQLPAADIGRILGCSESTVRVHLTRGRRNLAAKLEVVE